jgi:putative DNA primase/helicase
MNAKPHPKLIPLTEVKPEAISWLWPGRIPLGKIALIVGDPGLGKSFVAADISARVSHAGAMWPDGGDVPHGNAIIPSSEDSPADTIRPRIEAMGGDLARVHVLKMGVILPTPTELEALCAGGEVRVIVLDPLASFIGKVDPWKDTAVRSVMDPMAAVAARKNVAIIGIMHMTKAQERQALYRASGSVAFVAAARAGYVVVKDPDEDGRRVLAPIKFNIGPRPLRWPTGLSALPPSCSGNPSLWRTLT